MENILNSLIPIFVALPLVSALICLISKNSFKVSLYTYKISLLAIIITSAFYVKFFHTHDISSISYNLGGWSNEIGIEFKLNKLSSLYICIMSSILLSNIILFQDLISKSVSRNIILSMKLIIICGVNGMLISNDVFNIYVFLELTSIAAYILNVNPSNRNSYKVSFDYLLIGSISGCLMLIGIALLYASTGTLNINQIHEKLWTLDIHNSISQYSFILLIFAFLIKSGCFPMHKLMLSIYTNASPAISSFFTLTTSKIYLIMIMKISYILYGSSFINDHANYMKEIISIFGILSIIISSFYTLIEKDIIKVLAWSSIGQIGYIIVGIVTQNSIIFAGSIFQIISHMISKSMLFGIVGLILFRNNMKELNFENLRYYGVGNISFITIFLIMNLGGLPITLGFFSKIYITIGAIEMSQTWLLSAIILSSISGCLYSFRFIEAIIFSSKEISINKKNTANVFGKVILIINCIAILSLPFYNPFIDYVFTIMNSISI
jgi:multicomponent Na+:H+ antiporter subunit D